VRPPFRPHISFYRADLRKILAIVNDTRNSKHIQLYTDVNEMKTTEWLLHEAAKKADISQNVLGRTVPLGPLQAAAYKLDGAMKRTAKKIRWLTQLTAIIIVFNLNLIVKCSSSLITNVIISGNTMHKIHWDNRTSRSRGVPVEKNYKIL